MLSEYVVSIKYKKNRQLTFCKLFDRFRRNETDVPAYVVLYFASKGDGLLTRNATTNRRRDSSLHSVMSKEGHIQTSRLGGKKKKSAYTRENLSRDHRPPPRRDIARAFDKSDNNTCNARNARRYRFRTPPWRTRDTCSVQTVVYTGPRERIENLARRTGPLGNRIVRDRVGADKNRRYAARSSTNVCTVRVRGAHRTCSVRARMCVLCEFADDFVLIIDVRRMCDRRDNSQPPVPYYVQCV